MENPSRHNQKPTDEQAFLFVLGGTAVLGLVALVLSYFLKTPLPPQIKINGDAALLGIIATLPLVVFLWWFSNTKVEKFSKFRRSQIKFFAEVGFEFTPLRIILLAIGAGVMEEILFRGVLQTWLVGFSPVVIAVILPNILFGALHMRTLLYAIIAGLVGVYLGAIYILTDNLLTPIITHALYDAVALEYTRRAIADYRSVNDS